MDIDLLSKMVKEVILDNDSVTLPGIGSFVAELVPSTFSDKGYTINPPYRRLFFTQREGSDTLLVDAYCSSNDATREDATRILVEFLGEMKEVLKTRKSIVFPGLGRLRATRENNFFFVADEDLDIYPAGFGLESVSLKSHEETPEEVSAAIAGLKAVLDEEPTAEEPAAEEPAAEPVAEPVPDFSVEPVEDVLPEPEVPESAPEAPEGAPVAPVAASEAPTVPVEALAGVEEPVAVAEAEEYAPRPKRRFWRSLLVTLLVVIAAAALAVILFIIVDHFAPQVIDRLLYTPEQLKILYY